MDRPQYSPELAKKYARIKQRLSLFSLFLTPFLLLVFCVTPLSRSLADISSALAGPAYLQLAVYFTLFSCLFLLIEAPLSFYSGYLIEKRFQLTNHTLKSWLVFFVKRALLSFGFSVVLLMLLYTVIWHTANNWWLWAWAGYAMVSYVMGKLFPVWVVPLFYQYDKVGEGELKDRILKLTHTYKLPVENLYTLNLSKTTRKANAAFMGIGKTKRVVLSDTLIENFNESEIEAVVAHELGHYRHRDILKQLAAGLLMTFAGFALAARLMDVLCPQFGFSGAGDIAAMPLLFLIFTIFGLVWTPLQSAFSRRMEYAADYFALEATRNAAAFISCMEKLARVNYSDPDPHPLYEWYFYDHPCIKKRIHRAERWRQSAA